MNATHSFSRLARPLLMLIAVCMATAVPALAVELPQDHDYQRVLRKYMSKLTEKDFDHGFKDPAVFTVTVPDDPEKAYRDYMLSISTQPVIGTKRGRPCVTAPPALFLLSNIEGAETIMQPPVWSEPIGWLVQWDYKGNPYYKSKAMKRRVFVYMCVEMMMLDHQIETAPEKGGNRADWFAPHLTQLSFPYLSARDVLPRKVRKAYEVGLRKMARRSIDWGVKGDEINQDMSAAVGLYYATECLNDPDFTREARAFVHNLIAAPQSFHPAGYFIDRGGPELGFGGMTAILATWSAAASNWDFARESIDKYYRLRAHLNLPEPDGATVGPCHFNTRLDSEGWRDQWNWNFRFYGTSMLTDETVYLIDIPDAETIAAGHQTMIRKFNQAVTQNPRSRDKNGKRYYVESKDLKSHPWRFVIWPSWNWPVNVCYPNMHYRQGTYARLTRLKKENSPLLRSPFSRGETFVRTFENAFTVVRQPTFAAIVHTGPVGRDDPNSSVFHFAGPHGFGGGQLSTFWTPKAGSVLLGRRGGMSFHKVYDNIEDWKIWPIHAVSGRKGQVTVAAEGETPEKVTPKIFTSARIIDPKVTRTVTGDEAKINVSGLIPRESLGQGKVLEGNIHYSRTFEIDRQGVTVTTTVRAHSQDTIDELYETFPIFHRDPSRQRKEVPMAIRLKTGGKWQEATVEFVTGVTAIRINRFEGAVEIAFERPRRVSLSAKPFKQTYCTRAVSQNVLVDLLENDDNPAVLNGTKRVMYRLTAVDKP